MTPKFFSLAELVPPEVFTRRGEKAWELLRPDALEMLDRLRTQFGPCTVNNWQSGGQYKESGLRAFLTLTGAEYSMHKYGGAFDCKFRNATPEEVFQFVTNLPEKFPRITAVEDVAFTPTWFHFDVRNPSWSGIRVIKP